MTKKVNKKIEIEGIVDAYISRWSVTLNGEGLETIIRKAYGIETSEDFTRMLARVRIEFEPVETLLKVNGEPLPKEESDVA